MSIKNTRITEVSAKTNHELGRLVSRVTLAQVEKFCREARAAEFNDTDEVVLNDFMGNMTMRREEEV